MGKIENVINKAKNDLLSWNNVYKANTRGELKHKPDNIAQIDFDVMHETKDGYTWSTKSCYINTVDYTYKWHYGGIQKQDINFKDKIDNKLNTIKEELNLDFIYPEYVEMNYKHAILIGIEKSTTNELKKKTIFAYEDKDGNIQYKIEP